MDAAGLEPREKVFLLQFATGVNGKRLGFNSVRQELVLNFNIRTYEKEMNNGQNNLARKKFSITAALVFVP